jgi:hypothetical protein
VATKTKEQSAARDTLRDIYISMAEGMECTDEILGHIKRLEATLHPRDDGWQMPLDWRHAWDCATASGGYTPDV